MSTYMHLSKGVVWLVPIRSGMIHIHRKAPELYRDVSRRHAHSFEGKMLQLPPALLFSVQNQPYYSHKAR